MIRRWALAAALLAAPAVASTPAAEAALARDAARACRTASGLDHAAASSLVGFSDTSAMTVLLVTGTWRPRHMKGARATMLCLYDRRAKTAETQEAIGWAVRPR